MVNKYMGFVAFVLGMCLFGVGYFTGYNEREHATSEALATATEAIEAARISHDMFDLCIAHVNKQKLDDKGTGGQKWY